MHWRPDEDDRSLRRFVTRLVRLRRRLDGLLNPEIPHADAPPSRPGERDLIWREWHGVKLLQPDWGSWSHSLAWSLHDLRHGPLLWCGMNAYYQPMTFQLPEAAGGWQLVIDTGQAEGDGLAERPSAWGASEAPSGAAA
ncbi:hypothetical protein AAJV73_16160 [Cyanobium sp. BSA11S]|uniref:hypothetical protein n=1 Tax=Cyanobium sp. BSA11S TaxID=3108224 RepID=UPI003D813423